MMRARAAPCQAAGGNGLRMRLTAPAAAVLLLLLLPATVTAHQCVHDKITDDVASMGFPMANQHYARDGRQLHSNSTSRRLLTTFGSIRIFLDVSKLSGTGVENTYMCNPGDAAQGKSVTMSFGGTSHLCTAADELTAAKRAFLEDTILTEAERWFEDVLSVQRLVSPLVAIPFSDAQCAHSNVAYVCCASQMPMSHRTDGVPNTDLLVYVTARPTSGGTIAWATSCVLDQYGRPIVGQINFGPARMDLATRARHRQLAVAIHELTHIVGFSSSLYSYYRLPGNGAPRGLSNVRAASFENGKTMSKIITPTVVARAKQHFNCENWPNAGGELEDHGGAGTASSHWEKRVYRNEFMTGTASENPVYSALTLALFEDMGWYTVDYTRAQSLAWGRDAGCTFARDRCSEWSGVRYFCTQQGQSACTHDFLARGQCNLVNYGSHLPPFAQYFPAQPSWGGGDAHADYCPFVRPLLDGDCRDMGTLANTPRSLLGEMLGLASRCFEGTYSEGGILNNAHVTACLRTDCSTGALRVFIGSATVVTCPAGGGTVTVPSPYPGQLHCPPYQAMCGSSAFCPNACSGQGECRSDGTCQCAPGRTRNDCSGMQCPAVEGVQCSGHGTCNEDTGSCVCSPGYTGSACRDRLCPLGGGGGSGTSCSGHGTCDSETGECECEAGFSGLACERRDCPGDCSGNGACDYGTGVCACEFPYSQTNCAVADAAAAGTRELGLNATTLSVTSARDEYRYFHAYVPSAQFDVTVQATVQSASGASPRLHVYASFVSTRPSSLDATWTVSSVLVAGAQQAVLHICGSAPPFPRSSGATYCDSGDQAFLGPGELRVAVLARGESEVSYEVLGVRDPCSTPALAGCSGHGTCAGGTCQCHPDWSSFDCSLPSCPGTPHCFARGVCAAVDGRPECLCSPGWAPPDCSTPTGAISNLETVSALPAVRTGRLDVGQWRYFEVTVSAAEAAAGRLLEVQLSKTGEEVATYAAGAGEVMSWVALPSGGWRRFHDPAAVAAHSPGGGGGGASVDAALSASWQPFNGSAEQLGATVRRSDAMLFLRYNNLPTLLQYSVLDTHSWHRQALGARAVVDRHGGLRSGAWYVGVFNNVYGQRPLDFSLSIALHSTCPAAMQGCSGHGVCEVSPATDRPTCVCDARNDTVPQPVTYVGPHCSDAVTWLRDGDSAQGTLGAGAWFYASYEASTAQEVELALAPTAASPGCEGLLLVRQGRLPSLDSAAAIDFDAWARRSLRQTVTLRAPQLQAGTVFAAVHNRLYATGPCRFNLTLAARQQVTRRTCRELEEEAALRGRGNCSARAGRNASDVSAACGCRARCIDANGEASCQCPGGWQGATCNSPALTALSTLAEATQSIESLCNLCGLSATLPRSDFRIYRVAQPLQQVTGLNITVYSSANASGDPDVFVSEQLPRSIYDFVHIEANDGPQETLLLANRSRSGRFWLAVFARSGGTFQINSTRQQLPTQSHTQPFWDALWEWLSTTFPGNITLAVVGVLSLLLCLGCCWRMCQTPAEREKVVEGLRIMASRANVRRPSASEDEAVAAGAGGREGGRRVEMASIVNPMASHRGLLAGAHSVPPPGYLPDGSFVPPPPPPPPPPPGHYYPPASHPHAAAHHSPAGHHYVQAPVHAAVHHGHPAQHYGHHSPQAYAQAPAPYGHGPHAVPGHGAPRPSMLPNGMPAPPPPGMLPNGMAAPPPPSPAAASAPRMPRGLK